MLAEASASGDIESRKEASKRDKYQSESERKVKDTDYA